MDRCKFMNDEGRCAKRSSRTFDCQPATREWFNDDGEIIDISEVCKYSSLWGNTYTEITEEQLESLKEGKVLSIDDGEYGHFIILKGE